MPPKMLCLCAVATLLLVPVLFVAQLLVYALLQTKSSLFLKKLAKNQWTSCPNVFSQTIKVRLNL